MKVGSRLALGFAVVLAFTSGPVRPCAARPAAAATLAQRRPAPKRGAAVRELAPPARGRRLGGAAETEWEQF